MNLKLLLKRHLSHSVRDKLFCCSIVRISIIKIVIFLSHFFISSPLVFLFLLLLMTQIRIHRLFLWFNNFWFFTLTVLLLLLLFRFCGCLFGSHLLLFTFFIKLFLFNKLIFRLLSFLFFFVPDALQIWINLLVIMKVWVLEI